MKIVKLTATAFSKIRLFISVTEIVGDLLD